MGKNNFINVNYKMCPKKKNLTIRQYQFRKNIPFPHENEIDPENDPFHYKRLQFMRSKKHQYRFDLINSGKIIKNRVNTNV